MVVRLHANRFMSFCGCLFFLMIPSFGQVQASPPQNKPAPAPPASEGEKDRGQILKEIAATQEALFKDPNNAEARFKLARLLYQSGEFEKAKTSVLPLLDAAKPMNETLFLAADLDYLLGHYDKAESAYRKIIALNPGDLQGQARADSKLAMTFYQTNQYAKAADLFKGLEGKIKLPHWDLMRSFGQERPYQVVWPGDFGLSIAPFLVTDPLPIVSVEIQGRQIYALIDTGADLFMLDTEVAAAMGIKPLASITGTFAGGKQAEVGFGRVDSLKIGQVTLKAVPISILPTQRFSKGFADGKYTIGGIVGTGVLKQFLATMDYPGEQLVLRRADEEGRRDFRQATQGKAVVEAPFVLAMTHFIMARGSLDGKDGLTFFVDSGLASEAAFAAPAQTLKYAGVPIPETKVEDGIGGGGGGFATGLFKIARLGLGPLVQENLKGEYGANPPESYWRLGFINDGIISHQFLKKYAWTIDFARMTMTFAK
ncbi:MAG: aspartyl protease family protein [Candidatus Aminicenantes bacterium]|nr:aspartyl protease family protein [Candidatus Aminicenantes bacterium]